MHKQKRKFNRAKMIEIIVLIISLVMVLGSPLAFELEIISQPIIITLFVFGLIGVFISTFIIVTPDIKNKEIRKEILNRFFPPYKD